MSIELNRARVGGAIVACECAQAALGKAIKLAEESLQDLAAELKFGNDPATEEGAKLARFGAEVEEYMKALLSADLSSPHCGNAMEALRRVAIPSATQQPTADLIFERGRADARPVMVAIRRPSACGGAGTVPWRAIA